MGTSSGTESAGGLGVPGGRGTGMAKIEVWEGMEAGMDGETSTVLASR